MGCSPNSVAAAKAQEGNALAHFKGFVLILKWIVTDTFGLFTSEDQALLKGSQDPTEQEARRQSIVVQWKP